jgi:hypothetical protein
MFASWLLGTADRYLTFLFIYVFSFLAPLYVYIFILTYAWENDWCLQLCVRRLSVICSSCFL